MIDFGKYFGSTWVGIMTREKYLLVGICTNFGWGISAGIIWNNGKLKFFEKWGE